MRFRAIVVAIAPSAVRADHDHSHHAMPSDDATAGIGATHQGAYVVGAWTRGRFSVGVELAAYRLRRSGLLEYGLGDLNLHASVALVATPRVSAGVMAMATVPTGDARAGFGMGT